MMPSGLFGGGYFTYASYAVSGLLYKYMFCSRSDANWRCTDHTDCIVLFPVLRPKNKLDEVRMDVMRFCSGR